MFNENIDDIKNIVPSINIIKLYSMLKDIYKRGKFQYPLTPIDMMKIFISLGNKYITIDKIILLMFGVKSIKSFEVKEENTPIERFNINSLSDEEKAILNSEEETNKPKVLTTPVSILDTNVGIIVIGYDYAYVAKETFTPNIEISAEDKKISEDNEIKFNINYPYIKIDVYNNELITYPIYPYEIMKNNKQKYNIDYFIINDEKNIFKHCYSKQPIKFDENDTNKYIPKTVEEIYGTEHKIPIVEGYEFCRCYYKDLINMKLVLEYKNEDDNLFQFINYNDCSVATVSFNYSTNTYMREKNYFINYASEETQKQTEEERTTETQKEK